MLPGSATQQPGAGSMPAQSTSRISSLLTMALPRYNLRPIMSLSRRRLPFGAVAPRRPRACRFCSRSYPTVVTGTWPAPPPCATATQQEAPACGQSLADRTSAQPRSQGRPRVTRLATPRVPAMRSRLRRLEPHAGIFIVESRESPAP